MDLSISPDLDARVCYFIVFICGLVSARVQIYQRLSQLKIQGIWLAQSTWLMFLIYLFIPIVLFWLLGRIGAINDTSVFAAMLVGLAYPAVLSGGFGGLKAPAGVQAIFKPLDAFTATMVKSILQRIARNDRALEDFVVCKMKFCMSTGTQGPASPGAAPQTTLYDRVLDFVKTHFSHSASVDKHLKEFDDPRIDNKLKTDKKARLVYLYLTSIPDYLRTLERDQKLVNELFPWNRDWDWLKFPRRKEVVVIALACLVGIGFFSLAGIALAHSDIRMRYNIWRITKAKNSPQDRFRSSENLKTLLADETMGLRTRQRIAHQLRSPILKQEQVDQFLQLLLCGRHSGVAPTCENVLECLRVGSVETRGRIHDMLIFLAEEREPGFRTNETELIEWEARNGDSITSLERRVARWRTVLARLPAHPIAPAEPDPSLKLAVGSGGKPGNEKGKSEQASP